MQCFNFNKNEGAGILLYMYLLYRYIKGLVG